MKWLVLGNLNKINLLVKQYFENVYVFSIHILMYINFGKVLLFSLVVFFFVVAFIRKWIRKLCRENVDVGSKYIVKFHLISHLFAIFGKREFVESREEIHNICGNDNETHTEGKIYTNENTKAAKNERKYINKMCNKFKMNLQTHVCGDSTFFFCCCFCCLFLLLPLIYFQYIRLALNLVAYLFCCIYGIVRALLAWYQKLCNGNNSFICLCVCSSSSSGNT